MSKHKFRIWDKSIKKWMFGYDVLGGFNLIGEITLMGELSRISLKKLLNDDYAIMQYTGLKDKNGVEIYEGDVVLPQYNHLGPIEVIFKDGAYNISGYAIEECVIRGNIHENPELLTNH